MATQTKVFSVIPKGAEAPARLVRAERRSQVEALILKGFDILPASQDEMFDAAKRDIDIEDVEP